MVARVSLDIALRKEFDYAIPPELAGRVEVGSRVKVPFGNRELLGAVTALLAESPHKKLKPIVKVLGKQALLTASVLQLARWISEYYCCALETALKSVLPDSVRKEGEGWRERLCVRLVPRHGEFPKLTKRQQEVWNVIEEWKELPLQRLVELTECTPATIRRLEDAGLVSISPEISERDPYAAESILPTQPLKLNPDQEAALKEILGAMDAGTGGQLAELAQALESEPQLSLERVAKESGAPASRTDASKRLADRSNLTRTFLLHGVTGSGKTEIYLQAIAHALAQGKGAIVLVPEIALTPQTVERFKGRFCAGALQTMVAVLHSHLSAGERHDEWHKIRQGRARIVIGARSAVFAPVEPLGLIIVDEEHENSYKQEEAPRYHARDVAVMRAQMEGAVVVLGSATPSLESYFNAKKGKYRLLDLPVRADDAKMPLVRVVDMRSEARKGKGPPIFANILREAIAARLDRREQVMLFLNRRGYASSLQCPLCGYVAGCPNCSIALTYHRKIERLCCHLCGHAEPVPAACPQASCRNPAIRYSGLGTERVEETLGKLFPKANVRRMDSDSLKRKEDYRNILGDFRTGKIDILVGTQMIAKGLHFPNVTLVGIIYADLSLHMPDFRAGERTFQLLTQVAGRAGRGDIEGEVIVQAFTPFHPAVQLARRHDFAGFYEQELEFREQLKYPPFARAAMFTLKSRNEDKAKLSADYLKTQLEKELAPVKDLILAGPAPSPLLRAETYYRYQIMLRTRQMSRLSRLLAPLLGRLTLPEDVNLTVDIDPVNLS